MKINHFSDLICWQKALELTTEIYLVTEVSKKFEFNNQICKASISIMNNIAEGFGRFSQKDKLRFYEYVSASCLEVESMLYLSQELNMFPPEKQIYLKNIVVEVYKMTSFLSKGIRDKIDKRNLALLALLATLGPLAFLAF